MADQSAKQKSLGLSDFTVESVAFETRFSNSYLIWDKIGQVWSDMLVAFPELEVSDAQPVTTTFSLGSHTTFSVQLDKSFVVSRAASYPFPDLMKFGDALISTITVHLGIEAFTRVGLRVVHGRTFGRLAEASEYLLKTGVCSPPALPVFSIESGTIHPEYIIRWESENTGVIVRGKTETRKLDFKPPPGFQELVALSTEKYVLVLDVDYFNTGAITVGQFRASDWIRKAVNVIRNDFSKFIGGE